MAAIGALIACAAAATGLAPSLHLASLGMPRAATSGGTSRLPGGSSLEETAAWAFASSKLVGELRMMLREQGLSDRGRKPELVHRYAESQCVEDDEEEEGDEEEEEECDEEEDDEEEEDEEEGEDEEEEEDEEKEGEDQCEAEEGEEEDGHCADAAFAVSCTPSHRTTRSLCVCS